MQVTRRQFLKATGATAAALAITDLGFDTQKAKAAVKELRIKNVKPVPTICPFCGSGCGLVVYAEDKEGSETKLLSVQGDPDNPVNLGAACPKGAAMFNLREIYDPHTGKQIINPKRVQKPLYRAPYSEKWEEKDWDWMLNTIAERVKETRDKSFIHKENGIIVNRT
ncbi:formate dehydrogenase major subunit, partial [Thermosyntropha lipolytica DSM 11003]